MDERKKNAGELRYIRKTDPEYPEVLHHYERMPSGLYLKGNLPDPDRKTVAVVGARNCSSYGRNAAFHFAEVLVREGVQIISGLAYGIDTWAHKGALKGGGRTFAVLGCGADVCYPKENYLLYEELLKNGGGILSEYEPGTPPLAWHFPIRNRIISGLADLVLVVEARKKSGSLITADYALEQGKSIFAVPGRVDDACSAGCNALIAQGAGIAWNPEVLLEELYGSGWSEKEAGKKAEERKEGGRRERNLTPEQKKVLSCLSGTEQSMETISRESGVEIRSAASALTILCMEGFAVCRTPGYYCRMNQWT